MAEVEIQGEYQFERIRYSSNPEHLQLLAAWLIEHEVEEVVMDQLHIGNPSGEHWNGTGNRAAKSEKVQAQSREHSNYRKHDRIVDGRDARRIFPTPNVWVKRLVSDEPILSFAPDTKQQLWRTVTRRKYQLTRNKVRLQKPTADS